MLIKIKFRVYSILWKVVVNGIASWSVVPPKIRLMIYNLCGIKAKPCKIRDNCHFETNHVKLGKGTFINRYCYFFSAIEIGENCWIGPQVMFISESHEIGESEQRAGKSINLPIYIGEGTWVGARVNILPGVTIGDGCVIAAGSVVTKDCEPNGLYAGIPAKRIKDLEPKLTTKAI